MRIITINLSKNHLKVIKILTDLGIYESRSEAIRVALEEFLKDEITFLEELQSEKFKITIRSSLENRGINK